MVALSWLNDKTLIHINRLIWAGGVTPESRLLNLPCSHDKSGRLPANSYLEVTGYHGVYVLGDCGSIIDPYTRNPYPPTAQRAVREAKMVVTTSFVQ